MDLQTSFSHLLQDASWLTHACLHRGPRHAESRLSPGKEKWHQEGIHVGKPQGKGQTPHSAFTPAGVLPTPCLHP